MSSAAASGSSDIHCGGERKNVDEDDDVRDWRQFPEAVGAPLATNVEISLVKYHVPRLHRI
jgi:hypothetical protein